MQCWQLKATAFYILYIYKYLRFKNFLKRKIYDAHSFRFFKDTLTAFRKCGTRHEVIIGMTLGETPADVLMPEK